MATDITADDFTAAPADAIAREQEAVDAALEEARAALNEIRAKASAVDIALAENASYSLHDVPGVGRYAIARHSGWRPLLDIIHDKSANIDFSLKDYPYFDAKLGEQFNSPYLLDPLDDKYESFQSLRDNIAAVRNFLMTEYYVTPPEGMTPEKAKKSLEEIAEFVGDGLYNNWLWHGVIPHHHLGEPHIDLSHARKKNGEGAQYIYEKILEKQRHSNWMRPFAAVAALFGGKPAPEWMLPPASETGFTGGVHDISDISNATPMTAEVVAITTRIAELETRKANLRAAGTLNQMSGDLDALATHMLLTAEHMNSAATLAEPVRRDAIEIAKDILRKLKVSIGNVSVMDGLKLKPTDDMSAFGGIKGVAMVYERMLAWSRGIDASIMQNPSVMAATQAIGQLGYLAKREALDMARAAGNTVQAANLAEQLKRIPAAYVPGKGATLGSLLETLERGIDTLLSRAPVISSHTGSVAHARDNSQGSYMSGTPIAGVAQQVSATETAAQKNAKAALGDQLSAEIQAQQLLKRVADSSRAQVASQGGTAQTAQTASAVPSRAATGRAAVAQARATQSRPSTNTTAPVNPANPAALQQAQRNAANLAAQRHAHEQEEKLHHDHQQQQLAQQQAAKVSAAKAAIQKIDPNMLKGFQSATSTQGLTTQPIVGGKKAAASFTASVNSKAGTPVKAATTPLTDEELRRQQQTLPSAPQPPTKSGRSI